jgi:RNA polymerase sigma-70 factor (sigma-E family)
VALFAARRVDMTRLAHVITGSNAVAEDLVQEAFVRLRRVWHDVDDPPPYLRRIVVNLAREHLRHQGVVRRHAERHADGEAGARRGPTGDPELDDTWAAVRRLPHRQRAVLALRFYEDLPVAEIAEVLGCRPGTVKSALHRGLATLRKELS